MSFKQLIKAGAGWLYLNTPAGRRQLQGTGTILMLHRVIADDVRAALPHRAALCVGVQAFGHLLQWLKQHFDCVPLCRLLDPEVPMGERPRLALTFDDGWRDNAIHAFPLLKQHGVPASIFLSTDFIGNERRFWWEAVGETLWGSFGEVARQRLAKRLQDMYLTPPDKPGNVASDHVRSLHLARFLQGLKGLPAALLQELAESCPVPIEPHGLDWWQIRSMEASGLVRFGPHGASHAILTRLDDRSLALELKRSRDALDANCRTPLPVYCYPNGDHDARVQAALAREGYSLALGTRPGLLQAPAIVSLALPRISVSHQAAQRPTLLAWRILQGAREHAGKAQVQARTQAWPANGSAP